MLHRSGVDDHGLGKLALDFTRAPSGGGGMSTDPPDEDLSPSWPESPLLIAPSEQLDAAEEILVGPDVLLRLDEVQAHCEAAIALIQRWKARGPAGF